jgi:hypothetical protein
MPLTMRKRSIPPRSRTADGAEPTGQPADVEARRGDAARAVRAELHDHAAGVRNSREDLALRRRGPVVLDVVVVDRDFHGLRAVSDELLDRRNADVRAVDAGLEERGGLLVRFDEELDARGLE